MKLSSLFLQALVIVPIFAAEFHFFRTFYSPVFGTGWVLGAAIDRIRLSVRTGIDLTKK